jgi:hypothetical protein
VAWPALRKNPTEDDAPGGGTAAASKRIGLSDKVSELYSGVVFLVDIMSLIGIKLLRVASNESARTS